MKTFLYYFTFIIVIAFLNPILIYFSWYFFDFICNHLCDITYCFNTFFSVVLYACTITLYIIWSYKLFGENSFWNNEFEENSFWNNE